MTEPKNPYKTDERFRDIDRELESACGALSTIAEAVHSNAVEKGFQTPPQTLDTMAINTIGEISELWEAFRAKSLDNPCDKTEGMTALFGEGLTNQEEEIADILIRTLDLAARFKVDIAKAVRIKHGYNRSRGFRHGGKAALLVLPNVRSPLPRGLSSFKNGTPSVPVAASGSSCSD